MNNNTNKNIEDEFRSSQIYKVLKGSGIPAADAVAQGLNKAAAGIDGAVGEIASSFKYAAQNAAQNAGQNAARNVGQAAPQGYAANTQHGGVHHGQPQQTQPTPPTPPMKMVRRGSPAKFYIAGIAAMFYASNFPMYEIPHYIMFALVVAGVFFVSGKLFKGKKEFVPIEPEKPQARPEPQKAAQPEKQSKTGNPEVDKIIDEGHEYLVKLRAANDAIPEEGLSDDIDRMERASADIFRFVAAHPEKAPQIRKFMNYYLPTTMKLLNSYQRLSAQSVKGENITSAMFNIEGMMHTVADAFEKQLDALFTDEAMDISADISVFETMLKQEGFVDDKK